MTVPGTGRPSTRLETAKAFAGSALGPGPAKRLAAFGDGTLYVQAGEPVRFLAWLVDFAVFLLGSAAGIVVVALVDRRMELPGGTVALLFIGVLIAVPLLYGLCYGNGRALGAVLTGTQLVRSRDGGRVGLQACWAMLVRTLLLPLLVAAVVLGGAGAGGSLARTSIDRTATRQLHATGLVRLTDVRGG
ncbi:RDD family protein [Saccharothrix algeriensis]|uniref:RDD domain-containing protein n=1 Tax=Saccharothrix algeriensis TaxID=173560 RepID=A0ABS2S075_9PSEU|nr:RDD family protein [Saccharothrix algeriensis]MBM7809641.1 hypothetical protein [Saccharothrix algeriensis]